MRFEEIGDLTVHYTLDGDPGNPPLVLIHSLGTDLRIWDGVVPTLAADHHLVRYDLRGHGLTSCPRGPYQLDDFSRDLLGLLDRLEIDRCTLAGISIGGQIALRFALDHPERVGALVLADTGAKIGTAALWQDRIDGVREKGLAGMAPAILPRWFAETFAAEQPAAYTGFANMLARTPAEGYTGACAALATADMQAEVGQLQAPALILCGAADRATTPEFVASFAGTIPGAVYREIPGAGHHPPVENPDGTAAAILRFLHEVKN